jgi:outer membrane lipoprotein-sorting protein
MKTLQWAILLMTLGFSCQNGWAAEVTLDDVLERMSKRGSKIVSFRADIVQKKWTEILEEFDAGESGSLRFLKKNDQLFLRKDIDEPQPNHLLIADGEVVFYQPKIKQAQKYQLGNNKNKAEFLLLGFGTSREALDEAYEMRLLGEGEVAGKKTYNLELIPKSDQVSAYFSRIELWVDSKMWLPVQQKLMEPTEDYLMVTFSGIEINPKLSKGDFELKIPKNVKVVGG